MFFLYDTHLTYKLYSDNYLIYLYFVFPRPIIDIQYSIPLMVVAMRLKQTVHLTSSHQTPSTSEIQKSFPRGVSTKSSLDLTAVGTTSLQLHKDLDLNTSMRTGGHGLKSMSRSCAIESPLEALGAFYAGSSHPASDLFPSMR